MSASSERIELPELDPRITWSIRVLDGEGRVLAERTPEIVCRTASVGKLFLLVEVARCLDLVGKLLAPPAK